MSINCFENHIVQGRPPRSLRLQPFQDLIFRSTAGKPAFFAGDFPDTSIAYLISLSPCRKTSILRRKVSRSCHFRSELSVFGNL
ncbi:hypothetical protein MRB53_008123 [Persea americana]|uniref:Uncharacterized protein n=1 Tax=Persea americana TaxID=3435 RepID=A0ACC2MKX1_PERAE|nr:hypothetical protein MRB53_008123 [Persea americana]